MRVQSWHSMSGWCSAAGYQDAPELAVLRAYFASSRRNSLHLHQTIIQEDPCDCSNTTTTTSSTTSTSACPSSFSSSFSSSSPSFSSSSFPLRQLEITFVMLDFVMGCPCSHLSSYIQGVIVTSRVRCRRRVESSQCPGF